MNKIESYIERRDEKVVPIYYHLRSILLNFAPQMTELISYRIPFFDYYGKLCYLTDKKGEVQLTFIRGYLMSNYQEVLISKNRKYVCSIHFKSVSEINEEILRELLFEACEINKQVFNEKKK